MTIAQSLKLFMSGFAFWHFSSYANELKTIRISRKRQFMCYCASLIYDADNINDYSSCYGMSFVPNRTLECLLQSF